MVFYRFKAAALELVEEGFESSAVNCINSYLSEFDAKLAEGTLMLYCSYFLLPNVLLL